MQVQKRGAEELDPLQQKMVEIIQNGCGMRISEAMRLRVKDIDFANRQIQIRDAMFAKSRLVPMPKNLVASRIWWRLWSGGSRHARFCIGMMFQTGSLQCGCLMRWTGSIRMRIKSWVDSFCLRRIACRMIQGLGGCIGIIFIWIISRSICERR